MTEQLSIDVKLYVHCAHSGASQHHLIARRNSSKSWKHAGLRVDSAPDFSSKERNLPGHADAVCLESWIMFVWS